MKDAKGHGSDPRGAHSGGVQKVGQPVSQKVIDIIRSNPGGFSTTLAGQQPTSGYMVSLPGHTQILDAKELAGPRGPEIVNAYAAAHANVLKEPGAHVGGWTDKESGKTYLDVSHNIANREAAIKAGQARNQIAIWDVAKSDEIRTGGTGEEFANREEHSKPDVK